MVLLDAVIFFKIISKMNARVEWNVPYYTILVC